MKIYKFNMQTATRLNENFVKSDNSEQNLFGSLSDNIKEDRTPEDLLFQGMLNLDMLLYSKIDETETCDKCVFVAAPKLNNYLVACFDSDISDEVAKAITEMHTYYATFRNNVMATDSIIRNFDQIFAAISPTTVRKVL